METASLEIQGQIRRRQAAPLLVSLMAVVFGMGVLFLLVLDLQKVIPIVIVFGLFTIVLATILTPEIGSERWRQFGKPIFYGLLFVNVPLNVLAPFFTFSVGGLSGFWLRIVLDSCLLSTALFLVFKRQAHEQDRPAVKAYLMFLSWVVLVAAFHSQISTAVPAVLRIGAPFGYYMLAVACLRTPEDGKRSINAVLASTLLVIPVCIYQLISGNGLFEAEDYARLTGPYAFIQSPPVFSLYLLVMLFLAYSLFSDSAHHIKKRSAGWILIAILTVFLLLTETRAAWATLGLGCVAISSFRKRLKRAALLTLIPVLLILVVPTFQTRISEVGSEYFDISYRSVMAGSLGLRVATYTLMAPGITESPIWGHGFGSFAALFEDLYDVPKLAPHNDFLYLAFESGLVGLALYVWYLWKLAALPRLCAHGSSTGSRVAQAALISLVVVDFVLFFHNSIFATDIQGYILALLGISSAYLRMENAESARMLVNLKIGKAL